MYTTDKTLLKHVGKKLNALRHDRNMTVAKVKAETGIDVTEIESGEVDMPIDRLERLCDCYQISMVEFFKAIERQVQ